MWRRRTSNSCVWPSATSSAGRRTSPSCRTSWSGRLTYGIAFDASAVPGFGDEVHSDLFLHPDTGTLCMLPWRPDHGRVARMFCHVLRPNGAAFDADCRASAASGRGGRRADGHAPSPSARRWSSTSSAGTTTASPPAFPTTTPGTWTLPRRTRAKTSAGRSA